MLFKQFGGSLTKENKARYAQSPNWVDGTFQNLEPTSVSIEPRKLPKLLYKQFFRKEDRYPDKDLNVQSFDKAGFMADDSQVRMIWYGHSVVLLRVQGLTVLIDPMLGPNAAPVSPFPIPRFSSNTLDIIDSLPPIDLVLLSHDHYDHLDYASIDRLRGKVKQFYVALGAGRHLQSWKVEAAIQEFDWWDQQQFGDLTITYTPTRHFSGRGLNDRAKSLWGGWVIQTPHHRLYFSGDGGYGQHFKEVGRRLGPFDFGWMECGQYNESWRLIHLFPEESVQAAVDAGVRKIMPVHWGGFALAQHHWKEPVERFVKAAAAAELPVLTPALGACVQLEESGSEWWTGV